MTITRIATVVEGQGEVAAVPVLLRRMVAEIAPGAWIDVLRPYRVGRDSLIQVGGVERTLGVVAAGFGPETGYLILLDADDDCPAHVGPSLLTRLRTCRPDLVFAVVLANREFEAWFLAAASSLSGCRGLANNLDAQQHAERPRDCKGWLTDHRVDGRAYKPVTDQAALAKAFDLRMARANSSSFDKLWRDTERLLNGHGPGVVPFCPFR